VTIVLHLHIPRRERRGGAVLGDVAGQPGFQRLESRKELSHDHGVPLHVGRLDDPPLVHRRKLIELSEHLPVLFGRTDQIVHHDDLPRGDGDRVEGADGAIGHGFQELILGAELGACHRLGGSHTLGHCIGPTDFRGPPSLQ
jgi:hypothetical protein